MIVYKLTLKQKCVKQCKYLNTIMKCA